MKKSKVILAIALAVVLLITIISVPTFSWFTRPQSLTGSSMALSSKNNYRAYNGYNVSLATYSSSDGITYSSNALNNTGGNNSVCSSTVTAGNRDFYRTTITNSSTSEQTVSLYANSLMTDSVGFAIGVNNPTRSYRDFTLVSNAITEKANTETMRVYFKRPEKYDDHTWDYWMTGHYELKWWDNDGHQDAEEMHECTSDHMHYYADIPSYAVGGYFRIYNGTDTGGNRTKTVIFADWGQTQTDSQLFVAYNQYDYGDGSSNVIIGDHYHREGANIVNKYSSITIAPGSTFNASLYWPDRVASSMSYSSNNPSVFTVNSSTGVITAVSTGDAMLTSTATGQDFGDQKSATTAVYVADFDNNSYTDVPIVQNLRIPGARQDSTDNIVNVDWYVINNSSSDMTYTIDQLYLGM